MFSRQNSKLVFDDMENQIRQISLERQNQIDLVPSQNGYDAAIVSNITTPTGVHFRSQAFQPPKKIYQQMFYVLSSWISDAAILNELKNAKGSFIIIENATNAVVDFSLSQPYQCQKEDTLHQIF
ncbi:3772_t:CDS:2 [Funneliformis mosseae]|uniref:3772_t:CDS:1 n=1 Tax=Funneliformis mosseae TaxID=27381 RepID=A0A9N9FWT0_FUNMO|nr:3772_t:CDS:2 [Funneliformis mosseae]